MGQPLPGANRKSAKTPDPPPGEGSKRALRQKTRTEPLPGHGPSSKTKKKKTPQLKKKA